MGERWLVGAVAVVLSLAACGEEPSSRAASGEGSGEKATPETRSVGDREWVAVFETAPDSEDLEEQQARILERAEGNVLVGPAGCHEGLARELSVSRGDYVAGVVASTRAELRAAVRRVDQEPIFEGHLPLLCGD